MTAEFLQDDLIKELRVLFQDERFAGEDGARVPITCYAQDLPVQCAAQKKSPFPYCIVRLEEGNVSEANAPMDVRVVLIFGVADFERTLQGYRDVLHLITLVYTRFAKNPSLGKHFGCQYPIRWALQETTEAPYFIGAMELHFYAPGVQVEPIAF